MATFPEISTWLEINVQKAKAGKYEHALCKEDTDGRESIIPKLKVLIFDAHEDARNRLRSLVLGSLDPLAEGGTEDPAVGYPERLNLTTLKGYFGEILAGLVAENVGCLGHDDWQVPAYLFRFHLVEFQHLDMMQQTGEAAAVRPGRTGDDCLAFRRNGDGEIIAALFCEAKCTKGHKSSLIDDAHQKSSLSNLRPVDIPQLIEVLCDSDEPAAAHWVKALRKLYLRGTNPGSGYERMDQVTYVCGKSPASKTQKTWITTDKPHARYTGGRRLHVAEIHLTDVEELIEEIYGVA